MRRTTFILGAGFSAAAGFPLVRGLRERVVKLIQTDRHPIYEVFLQAGAQGFRDGQFAAGINRVDPEAQLGFEELLIELQKVCARATPCDPCHTTLRVLRIGCARLLWQEQNAIPNVPPAYENFAKRFFKPSEARHNALVSFNWDLLMEKSLEDAGVPWQYTTSSGPIAVLKPHGSINWSSYLESGGSCDYAGWKKISPHSVLSFDSLRPWSNSDSDEINSDFRYMLFPGDPEIPQQEAKAALIWSQVEATLAEAEALVFIGYSLPGYDSYSRDVFRRFAAGRDIAIYNPSAEHLADFRHLLGTHVQLFPQRFEESPFAQAA